MKSTFTLFAKVNNSYQQVYDLRFELPPVQNAILEDSLSLFNKCKKKIARNYSNKDGFQ
jgi:hypothetical protein